jgi:hypothetical protein
MVSPARVSAALVPVFRIRNQQKSPQEQSPAEIFY